MSHGDGLQLAFLVLDGLQVGRDPDVQGDPAVSLGIHDLVAVYRTNRRNAVCGHSALCLVTLQVCDQNARLPSCLVTGIIQTTNATCHWAVNTPQKWALKIP